MNKWLQDVWVNKLGFQFLFCRMIQKGLFLIFFDNKESQSKILNKQFWSVGNSSFRVVHWDPEACNDEILTLSCPKWITIKNVPTFLWYCVDKIAEPLGKIVKIDSSPSVLPHLDARLLIALKPDMVYPSEIVIRLNNKTYCCSIEYMGGIDAYHFCKVSGHFRSKCPLLSTKSSRSKTRAPGSPL